MEIKNASKSVNFVLPRPTAKIVGGFKVVYDYANYLAQSGWNVIISHDCEEIGTRFNLHSSLLKNALGKYLKHKEKWVKLDSRIKVYYVSTIEQLSRIKADIVVATAINTVNLVWMSYRDSPINKAYLIQDYENWDYSDISVKSTYRLSMSKITVSKWLYDVVKASSGDVDLYLCQNGLDLNNLKMVIPIEKRKDDSICFMYHEDHRKGVGLIKDILPILREQYPNMKISAFGAYEKPDWLDESVDYVSYAGIDDLVRLYNQSAIFICSSFEEGFGLTGAESMACGCALISTKTNGSKEYCSDSNSILIEKNDEKALYNSICDLIDNSDKRINVAIKGHEDIQKLSLIESHHKFEAILNHILEE